MQSFFNSRWMVNNGFLFQLIISSTWASPVVAAQSIIFQKVQTSVHIKPEEYPDLAWTGVCTSGSQIPYPVLGSFRNRIAFCTKFGLSQVQRFICNSPIWVFFPVYYTFENYLSKPLALVLALCCISNIYIHFKVSLHKDPI